MSDLETPLHPNWKTALVDFLVQFRWIVVIFVVLPISFTLYFLTYLGDVRSEMKSYKTRQKEHDENVQKVVKRLKDRNPSKDGLVYIRGLVILRLICLHSEMSLKSIKRE
ncbi:hypothetical protein EV2_018992 [Malus domestica]